MRALRFAMLALSRDWRSGELAVLLAALLVAVTALTGVGFFTDRIGQAVDQRAAEVLAADLRMRSPEPIADSYDTLARERDIATARVVSFPSVVFFGDGVRARPRSARWVRAIRCAASSRSRRRRLRRRARPTRFRAGARPGSIRACSRASARRSATASTSGWPGSA